MSVFDSFIKNPINFINKNNDVKKLIKVSKKLDEYYYNDKGIVEDKYYDELKDKIISLDPNNKYLKTIGAVVKDKKKVKLEYIIGSMTKPPLNKITSFIETFQKKYKGPYLLSDKLDGVCGVYYSKYRKLFSRGDGVNGFDISELLNVINIDINTNENLVIRGELIMSKENFKLFENDKVNARNLVSGVVNSKHVNTNEASYIDFIPYEIISPWMSFTDQFEKLKKISKNTVKHKKITSLNYSFLEKYFNNRISKSIYNIDGIIVSNDDNLARSTDLKPKYSFAFKNLDILESKQVKINEVLWQTSKDGYLKPVLSFDSILLGQVYINKATAFNAKYIYDNNLGKGSIVEIVRSGDVIPYVKNIIKSNKSPDMPKNIEWDWIESNVDIITVEMTKEQHIKELALFCSRIGIENLGEKNIKKLIDAGIDTIPKILNVTLSKLKDVENFTDLMPKKIYENIQEIIKNVRFYKFMASSNSLGRGIAEKTSHAIIQKYPNFYSLSLEESKDNLIEILMSVDGIAEKTANLIYYNLENLHNLVSQLPKEMKNRFINNPDIDENIKKNNIDISNETYVFSGKRFPEWDNILTSNGAKITTSVSNKTTAVISSKEDIKKMSNNKIVKAYDLGTKIYDHDEFYNAIIKNLI